MSAFRDDIRTLADLSEGLVLDGVVTNVTAFGAFVDIGVHQDGLVHVSEIADRFVEDTHAADLNASGRFPSHPQPNHGFAPRTRLVLHHVQAPHAQPPRRGR